jgi:hypothetical protein
MCLPSVVNDDNVLVRGGRGSEIWHFTLSDISCELPRISRTAFYEIINNLVGLSQVLSKMGSENAHGSAQDAEKGFGFECFTAIPQYLNHIDRVTGDETGLYSRMMEPNSNQGNGCTHIHQTS